MKKTTYFISVTLIAAILMYAIGSCTGITESNDPLPQYTFDIYPMIDTREVLIESNLGIGGLLINSSRDSLSGYRVDFSLSPDTNGAITAFAYLAPDSVNGFREEVTFYGNQDGNVVITGKIDNPDGSLMAQDTLSIKVINPVNG